MALRLAGAQAANFISGFEAALDALRSGGSGTVSGNGPPGGRGRPDDSVTCRDRVNELLSSFPVQLSDAIQERIDVAAPPAGAIGTDRADGILLCVPGSLAAKVKSTMPLPRPTPVATKVEESLQEFANRHAGRTDGEGDHGRRRIAAIDDACLALEPSMLLRRLALQRFVASPHTIGSRAGRCERRP